MEVKLTKTYLKKSVFPPTKPGDDPREDLLFKIGPVLPEVTSEDSYVGIESALHMTDKKIREKINKHQRSYVASVSIPNPSHIDLDAMYDQLLEKQMTILSVSSPPNNQKSAQSKVFDMESEKVSSSERRTEIDIKPNGTIIVKIDGRRHVVPPISIPLIKLDFNEIMNMDRIKQIEKTAPEKENNCSTSTDAQAQQVDSVSSTSEKTDRKKLVPPPIFKTPVKLPSRGLLNIDGLKKIAVTAPEKKKKRSTDAQVNAMPQVSKKKNNGSSTDAKVNLLPQASEKTDRTKPVARPSYKPLVKFVTVPKKKNNRSAGAQIKSLPQSSEKMDEGNLYGPPICISIEERSSKEIMTVGGLKKKYVTVPKKKNYSSIDAHFNSLPQASEKENKSSADAQVNSLPQDSQNNIKSSTDTLVNSPKASEKIFELVENVQVNSLSQASEKEDDYATNAQADSLSQDFDDDDEDVLDLYAEADDDFGLNF